MYYSGWGCWHWGRLWVWRGEGKGYMETIYWSILLWTKTSLKKNKVSLKRDRGGERFKSRKASQEIIKAHQLMMSSGIFQHSITIYFLKHFLCWVGPTTTKNVLTIALVLKLILIPSRSMQHKTIYWRKTVNSLGSQLAHRKWIRFWKKSSSFILLLKIHSLASGLWLLVKKYIYKTFKFNVEVK